MNWEGAAERYPEGLPDTVRSTLTHELQLIERLDYAPYFLTVNSIVRFARSQDILCQGRGAAIPQFATLGITSIDPDRNDLCSSASSGGTARAACIDVDFEHERSRF